MNPPTESEKRVNIICEETVRYSFVSHLSAALRRQGISVSVYTDTDPDDQNLGNRVSVVVMSETSIPWFAKFIERRRKNGYLMVPVFYSVDPSVVNQNIRLLEPVNQSRDSSNMILSDSELVGKIVRDVYGKVCPTERIGFYSRLADIENLLCEQPWEVRSLGIWGMPGIGKTTLAKAVFDYMSNDYDASCFIENFDEAFDKEGPHRLLEEEIGKTLKRKFGVSSSYITRPGLLRDKLGDTSILVVLDDVRNALIAESFLQRFDWIGPGSLIIITSRYKRVFALCQVNQIYKVQGLNEHEALQLFSQWAFEKDVPEQNDRELSMRVIDYANGNPLALRIYGQELKGKKTEMETVFLKLKQCPPQKIKDRLKSVYSALDDNEKYIFMDIACFFKGESVDYFVQLLKGCGYFPRIGIDGLVEKCLVTISENTLQINELIQDIILEIINGERIEMARCSTLWQPSSIRCLLEEELEANGEPNETPKCLLAAEDIKGVCLDTLNLIFDVNPDAFKKMASLRFLKVYNSFPKNAVGLIGLNFPKGLNSLPCELRLLHWENYPFESLPQGFDLQDLVELNMPYSQLKTLGARTMNLEMLKRIRLCHSQHLVKFTIHEYAQNIELINLQGCTRLERFPAMTKLQHLRVLNLAGCRNINIVPGLPPNIEELYLQGTSIEEIPVSTVTQFKPNNKELMNHLKSFPGFEHVDLESVTKLIKVSSYSQGIGKLVRLDMKDCFNLQSLPDIFSLESLQVLDLSNCYRLGKVEGFPRNMKELYLAGTAISELLKLPKSLEVLNAHDCHHLESVCLDFEQLPRHFVFSNYFKLSSETVVDFLENGLARLIRLVGQQNQEHIEAQVFNICFPADLCLRSCFRWRARSFALVELSPSMRNALSGFAMSVLVSFKDDFHNAVGLGIRCICTWEAKKGHFDRIERVFKCWAPKKAQRVEKDHIFIFYDAEMHPGAGEENSSNISDDEIKFEFQTVSGENKPLGTNCMVIECDVQLITALTSDTCLTELTRESEARSIIEETPPLLSVSNISYDETKFEFRTVSGENTAPTSDTGLTELTRESEAKSIIEETRPLLSEADATNCSPLSNEPHKLSSMPSKVRSKRNVFWKWVGCFPRVTSMSPKNIKIIRRTRVLEEALEESKEGKKKQVDEDPVEDKGHIKHSKDHVEEDVNIPPRCSGCDFVIEDGISGIAFGSVWHRECLWCLHCHKPIAMHEISDLKEPYHKPCYEEHRRLNCYVCKRKIRKGIKYNKHPFWMENYCPSHDDDGTPKCCSCERLEPRGMNYAMLPDHRWLCIECLEYAVMNTDVCQVLHIEIREFFEGLALKVEKDFPLILVEKHALDKAKEEEKSSCHHALVTRSLCLSEEQIVTSVFIGPRSGPNKQLTGLVTESLKVTRREVTAILIIYGLPWILTGYILAHQMMHAWLKLNGYTNLNLQLEEGLCQVLGHMWLDSQTYTIHPAEASTSNSTLRADATSSKEGDQSDFKKKLVEFCKYQIETDDSPLFGLGYKKVAKLMVSNDYNLKDTLKHIVSISKTIPDSKF